MAASAPFPNSGESRLETTARGKREGLESDAWWWVVRVNNGRDVAMETTEENEDSNGRLRTLWAYRIRVLWNIERSG